MKNVFIVGSKGIPSRYGGFETFVDKLTHYQKTSEIQYHVACMSNKSNEEFTYNGAKCFNVKVPSIGPAKAVLYDVMALKRVYRYIKKNEIKDAIVYILACRIGPFSRYFHQKFQKLGAQVLVNPDGHEWKRAKWNKAIRSYWKFSEKKMIKNADVIVCDSKAIQDYINESYKCYNPTSTFIAYGANIPENVQTDDAYIEWKKKWDLKYGYYLIVGRFVPENNYGLMINEFVKSDSKKSLVIVTNVEQNSFYQELEKSTHFASDKRIKFVGTIYDENLLIQVRNHAFAYLHGHEVGGTNPSLLEALAITELNILLDVNFNREVGGNASLYFNKESGSLVQTMRHAESLSSEVRIQLGELAKERIRTFYSWDLIVNQYEKLFLKN